MKHKTDQHTMDMFDKKREERPRKPETKTLAQRMAAYRERNKFNMLVEVPQEDGIDGR